MKLVYIVEDGRGNKKIGMTRDIKRRVSQLKTAIPNGIMSVMISDFMENAREVEKQLHEANRAYRLSGEWFSKVVDFCDIDFSYSTIDIARKSILTFQDSLEIIATDEDMTGQTFRVLMILMSNLEFDNYITIKQSAVAEKLKMNKSVISRAIKLLVGKSIILKVREGTTTGYKLNPTYGWKGKVENMEKAKEQMEKDKIINFPSAREVPEGLESPDIETYTDDIPY
ncbi:MAG: GIY-YIG nuclease family protein [Methylococcaceae bacterium]